VDVTGNLMSNSINTVAERIVQELNEHADELQSLICQIVTVLVSDLAQVVLDATLTTEAAGGMKTPDGTRRRTPGGVFFYLARQQLTQVQREAIFGNYWRHGQRECRKTGMAMLQQPATPVTELVEEMIPQIVHSLLSGEARIVKVTLIGRPGKVVQRKDTVLLTMENQGAGAPKGSTSATGRANALHGLADSEALAQGRRCAKKLRGCADCGGIAGV
jgi:hypothetical protein